MCLTSAVEGKFKRSIVFQENAVMPKHPHIVPSISKCLAECAVYPQGDGCIALYDQKSTQKNEKASLREKVLLKQAYSKLHVNDVTDVTQKTLVRVI